MKEMMDYKEVVACLKTASAQTLSFMADDLFKGKANKDLSKLGGVKKLRSEVSFGGKEQGMYIPVPVSVSKDFLSKLLDEGLIALKDGVKKDIFEPSAELPKATENPESTAAIKDGEKLEAVR